MTRKRLLGIPKKVEELPGFGLFGGKFQNRRKSLKRTSNQPEKFVANKIGTTALEVRKFDPESIWNRNASQSGPNFSGPNLAFTNLSSEAPTPNVGEASGEDLKLSELRVLALYFRYETL